VLGSFLILGALYLVHNLLTGRSRSVVLSLAALLIVLCGIFLSFSRGSWGATVVGMVVMIAIAFRSSHSRAFRRRIVVLASATVVVIGALVAGLLTVDNVAERFEDRATVTKDYDEGETGRFGNQRRGMAMLVEEPAGFGPLRWRRTFGLEPHNSYIGGFANGGWLGGFAFIALVLVTSFVGFRLCLTPSPFQRHAQIAWPALFMFFLQAFQIDVDHWRHVYMLLGMVWGLEAARVKWLATTRYAGAPDGRAGVPLGP
jgi:O-antigen ligase